MEGTRNVEVYKFWSENLKYREQLGKSRHRWKGNIKNGYSREELA
jgi:hypothetical protein